MAVCTCNADLSYVQCGSSTSRGFHGLSRGFGEYVVVLARYCPQEVRTTSTGCPEPADDIIFDPRRIRSLKILATMLVD